MKSEIRTKKLRISGMTCVACQNKIARKLQNTAGVVEAWVSYNEGTAAVTYDNDIISLDDITAVIERLDYKVVTTNSAAASNDSIVGTLIMILAVYMILQHLGLTSLLSSFPLAQAGTSYGMLFVIGLFTSVHCVAMCGGINLSQCIPSSASQVGESKLSTLKPSFLYNLGRVISYTAVGAVVGAVGSVVSFSGGFQGVIQIIAGIFMVIMGFNMLGIFPALRRFVPRMPRIFANKIESEKENSGSPLVVGLLNGLMPCGPLQAMQLYALSTGSALAGATSMFLFSLGTVPLMFGLGALSSVLTKKFTGKVMTAGAVLVVLLGFSMFQTGWVLSGWNLSGMLAPTSAGTRQPSAAAGSSSSPSLENGVQIINSTLSSRAYPKITVAAGVPVKWLIDAPAGSITGCNNRMIIPEYNIQHTFQQGENVVEFFPEKIGKFDYSCWMGMVRSSITVVENTGETSGESVEAYSSRGYSNNDVYNTAVEPSAEPAPTPANVAIPTDLFAIADVDDDTQTVTIELTDSGFLPAVMVVQAGLETEWIIKNSSSSPTNPFLLVPAYGSRIELEPGENPLYLYPSGDFDFSNDDNSLYGYLKVVDDIHTIDRDAIRGQIADYKTLIWSDEVFAAGGAGCH